MDLGIKGRKAIVCASSKGLGRACALALAEAGCEVVVNGRNRDELARTAKDIRERTGATVLEVAGDLDDPATRAALIAACPEADILVNNNGGPPFKAFAAITREDILKGVESNMLTPIALAQALPAGDGGAQVRANHQHHLGLGARADRRPGRLVGRPRRPHRIPRVRRPRPCPRQRDDQFDPAGRVRDRPDTVVAGADRCAARDLARVGAGAKRRREIPPIASAIRPSSARSARFSRARRQASSPGRTF